MLEVCLLGLFMARISHLQGAGDKSIQLGREEDLNLVLDVESRALITRSHHLLNELRWESVGTTLTHNYI